MFLAAIYGTNDAGMNATKIIEQHYNVYAQEAGEGTISVAYFVDTTNKAVGGLIGDAPRPWTGYFFGLLASPLP